MSAHSRCAPGVVERASAPAMKRNGGRFSSAIVSSAWASLAGSPPCLPVAGVEPVGDLDLTCEMLELAADPGLHLLAFSAERGSKTQDALDVLGSWAATMEPAPEHAGNEA
jgi:hypothetical protein